MLTRMIAEDRRGDAVKYYMTEIIGLPRFMPTLVMAGTKTWPVLLDAARAVAAAIPPARHQTLPGQSHNVVAKAIAPVLESFLKL